MPWKEKNKLDRMLNGFSPGIQRLSRLSQEEDCNSRPSPPLKKDNLEDSVLFPPCGSWSSNPGSQSWRQAPLPTPSSPQALNSSFRVDSVRDEKYMGYDKWHRVTYKTYKIIQNEAREK